MNLPDEKMEITCKAIDSFIALYRNVETEQFRNIDYRDINFKRDALEKALCNTIKSSEIMEETDSELIGQMAELLYFKYENEKAIIKNANLYKKDKRIVLEEFYIRCLWLINNKENIRIKLLEDIFIRWEYFLYFGGGTDYPEEGRRITKKLLEDVRRQSGEEIMNAEYFRNYIIKIQSDFGFVLNNKIQEKETGCHQKYLGSGAIRAKVDDYIGQAYTIYNGVVYSND